MDNRFGLIVVMVGGSFVLWLHNTGRLPAVVSAIKNPPETPTKLGTVPPVVLTGKVKK